MPRPQIYLKENNELSPSKVMLTTGMIAGTVILLAAAVAATYPVSTVGVIALAIICAALAAGLLYHLVIAPLALAEPVPADDKSVLTTIDPLTRTLNRRGVTSSLLEAMAQAQRYSTPLSIALISIDDFRRLSDKRGQATANSLLQVVSQTITEVLRLPDRVGRHTQEEFLVVMPQTKVGAATKVAERIRVAVGNATTGLIDNGPVTVSIGVAEFNKDQDLEKVLSHAQAALSLARDEGNKVVRHKAEKKR